MNLSTNNQLNLAGLLLFGDKPQLYKPEFTVKAVTFAGTGIADSYLDSEDFEGSLSAIFQGALSFIMRNLRKIQKQKGVNTTGEPEIPQIVFEELLVNALIHRDYFVSAPVRLFIFDDRVEIINPGNLPDHLTIEKIRAGNSIQRNPILASFAAKGLLPYRGLGTGVKMQNASINAPINASLSLLQQQILEILREDSNASYELLVTKLDKDRTTIMRNIQKMKEMGILHRSGSKKTGSWEVV